MNRIWNSALGLLIVTGTLLGLTLPFGKMAGEFGVIPVVWAFLISSGAGGLLLFAHTIRGGRLKPSLHHLRYFVIAAAISYAIPNILMFSAMPHLGAGYMGIMFTLSPIITLALSAVFAVRRPNALGTAGIVIGFAGAVLVAMTRGEAGQPADTHWIAVALLVPVSLACGNIYRTYDWPADAGPIELAIGSHLASAVMLFLVMLALGEAGSIQTLARVPELSLAQVASAAGMFVFFFRLQAVGGPVYLSQIGYVAAAIGLFSGTIFLGEHYQMMTWLGAAVIVVGVVLTTRAQTQAR